MLCLQCMLRNSIVVGSWFQLDTMCYGETSHCITRQDSMINFVTCWAWCSQSIRKERRFVCNLDHGIYWIYVLMCQKRTLQLFNKMSICLDFFSPNVFRCTEDLVTFSACCFLFVFAQECWCTKFRGLKKKKKSKSTASLNLLVHHLTIIGFDERRKTQT